MHSKEVLIGRTVRGHRLSGSSLLRLLTIVACVASTSVVVAGVLAPSAGARQTNTHTTAAASTSRSTSARSLRAQVHRILVPVNAFGRTTAADAKRMRASVSADLDRINRCTLPYYKRLTSGARGSNRIKLYALYASKGVGLEQDQADIAPIRPQLATLARSLANLRLNSPIMRSFARGLATKFNTELRAPKFNSCAFIRGIARHHFSLAWARRSRFGRVAARFWNQMRAADKRTEPFLRLVVSRALVSEAQFIRLTSLPGV